MSISRKEALAQLKNMFPTYDKSALSTLLRANDNMLNQTIEYIIQLTEEEAKQHQAKEESGEDRGAFGQSTEFGSSAFGGTNERSAFEELDSNEERSAFEDEPETSSYIFIVANLHSSRTRIKSSSYLRRRKKSEAGNQQTSYLQWRCSRDMMKESNRNCSKLRLREIQQHNRSSVILQAQLNSSKDRYYDEEDDSEGQNATAQSQAQQQQRIMRQQQEQELLWKQAQQQKQASQSKAQSRPQTSTTQNQQTIPKQQQQKQQQPTSNSQKQQKEQSSKQKASDSKSGTNKIAGFFKGAFQEIKEAFTIDNKKQPSSSQVEENKSANNGHRNSLKESQTQAQNGHQEEPKQNNGVTPAKKLSQEATILNEYVKIQQNQRQNQLNYLTSYLQLGGLNSPKRHPKSSQDQRAVNQDGQEYEVIEEIVFKHPNYSNPLAMIECQMKIQNRGSSQNSNNLSNKSSQHSSNNRSSQNGFNQQQQRQMQSNSLMQEEEEADFGITELDYFRKNGYA